MKITFFGTAAGSPRPGSKCSCTLIQIGEQMYFIDMGTNALEQIVERDLDESNVCGIFITHMHGDHTDGLVGFLNDVNCSRKCTPPVFLPVVEAGQVIIDWINVNLVHARPELDFRQVKQGLLLDDGFIRVTAYQNTHCYNSFSYLVEAEGKAVIFSGDLNGSWETDRFSLALPKIETQLPVALMVCEAAHGKVDYYREHIQRLKPQTFVFNHISGFATESTKNLQESLPAQTFLYAQDGMELEL